MKKIITLIISVLALLPSSAVAADYVPLVREGVRWLYWYCKESGADDVEYFAEFRGDSIINGYTYKKAYRYKAVPGAKLDVTRTTPVALMREENKVVYVVDLDDGIKANSEFYGSGNWNTCILDGPNEEVCELVAYDFNSAESMIKTKGDWVSFFEPEYIQCESGEFPLLDNTKRNLIKAYYGEGSDRSLFCSIADGIGPTSQTDGPSGDVIEPYGTFCTCGEGIMLLAVCETGSDGVETPVYAADGVVDDHLKELLGWAGVEGVPLDRVVKGVRYYNLQGVESARPMPGVSIKVTTYSDGTTRAEKVVK